MTDKSMLSPLLGKGVSNRAKDGPEPDIPEADGPYSPIPPRPATSHKPGSEEWRESAAEAVRQNGRGLRRWM